MLKILVTKVKDIHARNIENRSPLDKAVSLEDHRYALCLINHGALETYNGSRKRLLLNTNNIIIFNLIANEDTNKFYFTNGETFAHKYVNENNITKLMIVESRGCNLHTVDNDGNNLLHYAFLSQYENKDMTSYLLRKNIDLHQKNNNDITPFNMAVEKGYSTIGDQFYKLAMNTECCICLEEFNAINTAIKLDCNHHVCFQCACNMAKNLDFRCPLCRTYCYTITKDILPEIKFE